MMEGTSGSSTSVYSKDKMMERRFTEITAYEMELPKKWNILRPKEETSGK